MKNQTRNSPVNLASSHKTTENKPQFVGFLPYSLMLPGESLESLSSHVLGDMDGDAATGIYGCEM
jgi:hypothetical protein